MYIPKKIGCEQISNDTPKDIIAYQPTPEGVDILCDYYCKKYNITLQTYEVKAVHHNQERASFEELSKSRLIKEITNGEKIGVILSNEQNHAIPVLLFKKNDRLHLYIFDSTSGPYISSYYDIARIFSDAKVYLNNGTRQADKVSCITDAICVLKDALRINNLNELIELKIANEPCALAHPSSRIKKLYKLKPANFSLFNMPEQLLKTAQRSTYLELSGADLETVINPKKNSSLRAFRESHSIKAQVTDSRARTQIASINNYLFFKSNRHSLILDQQCSNIIARHFQCT